MTKPQKSDERFLVVVDSAGERTWSDHADLEEAESEASIHRENGDLVIGVFPVAKVPVQFPKLMRDDRAVIAEIYFSPKDIERRKTEIVTKCVVGCVGGIEVSVAELFSLENWLKSARAYLTKHGYQWKESK